MSLESLKGTWVELGSARALMHIPKAVRDRLMLLASEALRPPKTKQCSTTKTSINHKTYLCQGPIAVTHCSMLITQTQCSGIVWPVALLHVHMAVFGATCPLLSIDGKKKKKKKNHIQVYPKSARLGILALILQ